MSFRPSARKISSETFVMRGEPDYLHPGRFKSKIQERIENDSKEIEFVTQTVKEKKGRPYVYFADFKNNQPSKRVQLRGKEIEQRNIKSILEQNAFSGSDSSHTEAKYFAEGSSTLLVEETADGDGPPQAFLLGPVSRKGTSRGDFGLAPCGGGSKGQARYMADPGEKTEVEWLIQNPAAGGHCQIKLSRGNGDDPNSFETLVVEGNGFDKSTGKFNCGDPEKAVEVAVVKLPYDTSCPD